MYEFLSWSFVSNLTACAVGKIVTIHFAAIKTTSQSEDESLTLALKNWEDNLPYDMIYRGLDDGLGSSFWACMLHICYKYSAPLLKLHHAALLN